MSTPRIHEPTKCTRHSCGRRDPMHRVPPWALRPAPPKPVLPLAVGGPALSARSGLRSRRDVYLATQATGAVSVQARAPAAAPQPSYERVCRRSQPRRSERLTHPASGARVGRPALAAAVHVRTPAPPGESGRPCARCSRGSSAGGTCGAFGSGTCCSLVAVAAAGLPVLLGPSLSSGRFAFRHGDGCFIAAGGCEDTELD